MKKIQVIVTVLWALTAFNVKATRLTPQQAAMRAETILRQMPNISKPQTFSGTSQKSQVYLALAETRRQLYIFNIADGGFIIAPVSDASFPVLGYVSDGKYVEANLPAGMKAWIDYYETALSTMAETSVVSKTTEVERQTVMPLLKSRWGQGDPYNRMCPEVEGEKCVTGCVATAIAQILYYYGQPASSKAIYPYRTNTLKLQMSRLPASDFDWDAMTDVYGSSSTDASCDAVAKLMLYCGCAFTMDYTPSGSGADVTPVCDGAPYYFGYDTSMKLIDRKDYTDEIWENTVYKQIAAGIPVLYNGRNSESGHAFVCDGYDNGLFHINWGWSGFCDSWFRLSVLNPYSTTEEGDGYSDSQSAVINFKPSGWTTDISLRGDVNDDGVVNGTDIQAIINFIVEGEYDEKADVNEDGKVNGTDIQEVINIIVNAD